MTSKQFLYFSKKNFSKCLELLEKKNHDYSIGDDALRNFKAALLVKIDPADGILVRMTDKLVRIGNLIHHPARVKDEKIQDTLQDLINYSIILLAYLSEKHED